MPAVLLGIVALRYLTDTPEAAAWLPEDEKQWLLDAIRRDRADATQPPATTLSTALLDPVVAALAANLFLIVTSGHGFSFFLPPPFWSLPTTFLRGDGAAAGIAFINAVGNLGGFLGPFAMGWMKDVSGDYLIGPRLLAGAALISAILVVVGTRFIRRATAETPKYRSAWS